MVCWYFPALFHTASLLRNAEFVCVCLCVCVRVCGCGMRVNGGGISLCFFTPRPSLLYAESRVTRLKRQNEIYSRSERDA